MRKTHPVWLALLSVATILFSAKRALAEDGKHLFTVAASCLLLLSARADVALHGLFTDHMVLQRDMPARVYGTADAGEQVTVSIAGQTATAEARDGKWEITLTPIPAGGPFTLTARGKNTVELEDVLIGDVWLCTGQSNMAGVLRNYKGAGYKDYEALFTDIPGTQTLARVRLFRVAQVADDEPRTDVPTDPAFGSSWRACDPESALLFSCTGYFFGRALQPEIGVPVGLVYGTLGGTAAESWVSRDVLDSRPEYKDILDGFKQACDRYPESFSAFERNMNEWKAKRKAGEEVRRAPRPPMGPDHVKRPSGLFNAVIAPLQRFAIKGAIWYQGESNSGRPEQYKLLFADLITSWRKQWSQGDFPFLFVQLAAFRKPEPEPRDASWPWLRESQTATLALPNTGMALAIDLGHQTNIHPPYKEEVGRRLALCALRVAYGRDVVDSGPVFRKATIDGSTVVVEFDQVHGSLVAKECELDGDIHLPADELRGFAICGEDGKFQWARAEIRGNRVVVSNPETVPEPVAVRYAWDDFPICNLYDQSGLPARPFRTDNFERGASSRVGGIAVGKPVTCSHPINHAQGFFAGLTDGSTVDSRENSFATNAALSFPKTVTVDLQGSHTVSAIRVYNSSFGGTRNVKVQVGNADGSFREVGAAEFENYEAAVHDCGKLAEKGVTQIRLVFEDVHATSFQHRKNGFVFLRELEVRGTAE